MTIRFVIGDEPASTISTPEHFYSSGGPVHPVDRSGFTASVYFGIVIAKAESGVMQYSDQTILTLPRQVTP
jgi:hypothetical protein